VDVSPGSLGFLGYEKAEILGKTAAELGLWDSRETEGG
jgi:hypothetical protein